MKVRIEVSVKCNNITFIKMYFLPPHTLLDAKETLLRDKFVFFNSHVLMRSDVCTVTLK